jgi:uncharacterized protein YxjI
MQKTLSVATQSWLKDDLQVTDAAGKTLYTASWHAGFPTASWTLKQGGKEIATLRRKALALLRTCIVNMDGHEFQLKNTLSMSRRTEVEGGPFDGAVLSGNLTDLDFRLEHRTDLVAQAEGKVVSADNRHTVRLMNDDPTAEVLTALMMVDLLVQQHEES